MSAIVSALLDEAYYQARRLEDATPALNADLRQLERDQADLEKRIAEIKAQLEAARVAQKRVLNYQPSIEADFQCPRCWIVNEVRSALRAVPSQTSDDILRCGACGADVIIPGR